jgi:hypothetical protein
VVSSFQSLHEARVDVLDGLVEVRQEPSAVGKAQRFRFDLPAELKPHLQSGESASQLACRALPILAMDGQVSPDASS